MSGGRLQEVPNTVIDLETFGSLVNWSPRSDRLREVVATGGSTVFRSKAAAMQSGY